MVARLACGGFGDTIALIHNQIVVYGCAFGGWLDKALV
jgi:hypothetical protein